MNDENKTGSPGEFRVQDPLRVIENHARQIWMERGKPEGTSWKDFVEEAESLILGGSSHPAEAPPQASEAPEKLPPRLLAFRSNQTDPLLSAIAAAIQRPLSEHESRCLGHILLSNEFELADRGSAAMTVDQVAAILAAVSSEYDAQFLQQVDAVNWDTASEPKLAEYWRQRILDWRKDRRSADNLDKNTLERLTDDICIQPQIRSMRPIGEVKAHV